MLEQDIEKSEELNLQFDSKGLLPAIVQDETSGQILMLAYVNKEAINLSIESGYATFWSRSRKSIWKKGETSGNLMKIKNIFIDCDQDCLIFMVEPSAGGACHTKNDNDEYRKSCFYRKVNLESKKLIFTEK